MNQLQCALLKGSAIMMRQAYAVGLLTAFSLALVAPANADALDGQGVREAVSGRTVYQTLGPGTEVSIRYRSDGTMQGAVKGVAAAMAAGQPKRDIGHWRIKNDQLCQRWDQWLEGRSYCYQFARKDGTVTWQRNDGRSGTVRLGN